MAIKHAFTSAQPDGPDSAKVRASNWNADHVIEDGTVALAKLVNIATDRLIGRATAGSGAPELITLTAAGRALLDDADAGAQRTTLGLGSAAVEAAGAFAAASHGHIIADVTGLQTALDNKLDDSQATAFGLSLLDDADATAARTTLGLGTAATQSSGAFEASGAAASAIAAHEAAGNPHPTYLTQAEADALYEPDGGAASAIAAHEAAGNPHPGYLTEAEADALYEPIGGGGSAASVSSVTVDFGSNGNRERFFDVTVTGATPGQQVVATPSLDMPAGVAEDELEMDMLTCAARVVSADTVRLLVASIGGNIYGQRNINLTLG